MRNPIRPVAVLAATAVAAALLSSCAAVDAAVSRSQPSSAPAVRPPSAESAESGESDAPSVARPAAARAVDRATASTVRPPSRPAPAPCAGNQHDQLVLVDLSDQHLWMCDHHKLVKDTPITSGMSGADTETPTGDYEIQGLNKNSTLTLSNGDQYDVKYWIPFDAPNFGFHDSSWQKFPYGSGQYRTDGSHGCVHMPLAAIAFLDKWADIGTAVRITH